MTTQQLSSAPRRRWLSFSLRSFLIVVTIACVWLAIVAARARNQKQAVDRIQELRGTLYFDYQEDVQGNRLQNTQPKAPEWLRKAIGDDYFRRVVTVDFNFGGGNKVTDKDLVIFRSLPDVTTLELNNNPDVSDVGLAHLAGLNKLRTLYLHRTRIKGPGIRHLPRSIEVLMLSRTPLEDEGLERIKNLTRLTALRVSHTRITDEGLRGLTELPALEDLELRNTKVTNEGLELLKPLKNLKWLSLQHTNVTGAGILRLQKSLPNCMISPDADWVDAKPEDVDLWPDNYKPSTAEILAKIEELGGHVEIDKSRPGQPIISLRLFDSSISDKSLFRLLAEMPELEQLNLRRVLVGDRLAKELPRLSKLWELSLEDSRITDDGLASIGRMKTLEILVLSNTKTSDAGFIQLAGLAKLQHLLAHECDLSDDGYAKLNQALPECNISW